jgi:hypothetical protein
MRRTIVLATLVAFMVTGFVTGVGAVDPTLGASPPVPSFIHHARVKLDDRLGILLHWTDAQPDTAHRYRLQRIVNGAWETVYVGTEPSAEALVPTDGTSRFRVRVEDANTGSVGAYAVSRPWSLTPYQEDAGLYQGTWLDQDLEGAWHGHVKYTETGADSVKFGFDGRAFAFITTLGPIYGKDVQLSVDGQPRGTNHTYRTKYKYRVVEWSYNWGSNGTHNAVISLQGVTPRFARRLDVDGFVVMRWEAPAP